jgi:hypothetical protein
VLPPAPQPLGEQSEGATVQGLPKPEGPMTIVVPPRTPVWRNAGSNAQGAPGTGSAGPKCRSKNDGVVLQSVS